jgi:hypothetical protein
MSKDRHQDPWKSPKPNARKGWDRSLVREHDAEAADRPHPSAKALKTYGAQHDEARRQIRELQSRY